VKRIVIKLLAGAFTAAALMAAMPAAALPGMGAVRPQVPAARQPIGPGRTSIMEHPEKLDEFEELIGHEFTASELSQIQRVADQVAAVNTDDPNRVRNVRWDIGNTGYEFTVLICGQFKMQLDGLIPQRAKDVVGKLPPVLKDKVNGVIAKGNGEFVPCHDFHTGTSYVMAGASAGATGSPSILSGGISIGIYLNSKAEKMIVGNYVFGRASMNFAGFGRWDAITAGGDLRCLDSAINVVRDFTVDFSTCRRFFISTGLSFDLGGALWARLKAIRQKAEATPPGSGVTVSAGVWSFSGGVIVKVYEFPWRQRMNEGQTMKEAFSDMDTYIAAQNN